MPTTTSEDLLDRLQTNINTVSQDSSQPLETRTYEEAELVIAKKLSKDQRLPLIQGLVGLLPILQQDPTPAVNLLLRLLEDFSYADILGLGAQHLPWVDGLAVGEHMVSYNRLMLNLLDKATAKPADAAHVASMLDTMLALVRLWLCTSDSGVASQGCRLLLDLLKIDQEIVADPDAHLPSGGQGLVWKRMFGDRNVYGTFFEACTLSGPSALKLSRNQRTLAQARLMEWLPAVGALDWTAITKSHHEDIELTYDAKEGLLEFATSKMVDYKDDVLMHQCLIAFYSSLLEATKSNETSVSASADSPALRYLITQGVHTRTAAIYLQPFGTPSDPLEAMFLYGPAANYIATYASCFPRHFLASQMSKQVNEHLLRVLDISASRWAHADSPKHDLHLLASLPRRSLLPGGDGNGPWSSSPVSLLPSQSTNPDVLNTLATLFHGPQKQPFQFPAASPLLAIDGEEEVEAASARALYYTYLANNQRFWKDLAVHADTVALKDLALSAINCLHAVITAKWSTKPDLILPTTIPTPDPGHLALLSPPALEHALPYLLKPPQTFSNLVGGRGDAESAAYKIAAAKFDAVRALHGRLVTQVERTPGEGYEEIVATLGKRIAEGPLSREGEVGGRIATLEL